MVQLILLAAVLISLLIRLFFISQSKHIADIYLMYTMGAVFLEGKNPYLVLDFNAYPPLAIFLEAASMQISSNLQTSFVSVLKFWPNLADFITAFVIYKVLVKTKIKPVSAALWSGFFLLNPISIIISSAHGQLDSIPSLFVLLSISILMLKSKKIFFYLSAILLGIAITIKPNPAMLIPLFLFYKRINLKQRIIYLILIFIPIIVTLFPFLGQDPNEVLVRVLSYSGVNDISFAAILRGIWYQNNAVTNLPLTFHFLSVSKFIFASAAITLILLFAGWKNLAKSCLAIYLMFLTSYFGIGSQYLVWLIPLATLARDKMVFYYTIFGLLALVGFYLFFGPDILLGKLTSLEPFQPKNIYLYFYGNLVFWIFSLSWLINIIYQFYEAHFFSLGILRRKLIYFTFLLFILSLVPQGYLIKELFNSLP